MKMPVPPALQLWKRARKQDLIVETHLRLTLLPLVRLCKQLGEVGSLLVVRGENPIPVLLVRVVVQLAALLDRAGNLFEEVDCFVAGAVCPFEMSPLLENSGALCDC